jgi:DNA-binding MarR family transcriptional regulator
MAESRRNWVFVTSHAAMLIEVKRDPGATVRDLAERANVTERQAHRVLADLAEEGYITRERIGRRNRYRINDARPMRRDSVADRKIGDLLDLLVPPE